MAHVAQWGLCLARTDPDVAKHEGITCFAVDMATPGIEIRPLRELTGAAMFELTRRHFNRQWGEVQEDIEKEIKRREAIST